MASKLKAAATAVVAPAGDQSANPLEASAPAAVEVIADATRLAGDIPEVGEDGDGKKDNIITILEEWAAWERGLEEEAERDEVARGIKELADRPISSVDANSAKHAERHENRRVVAEFEGNSSLGAAAARTDKVIGTTYSPVGTGGAFPTRRDRRRAERNDPVARARRKALKVWAADQTRRRSSAQQLAGLESLDPPGWTSKESASLQIKRRSSAAVTENHNRNGGEPWDTRWVRSRPSPSPPASQRLQLEAGQRESSPRHCVPTSRSSEHQLPLSTDKVSTPSGRNGQRRRDPHPWRANMKTPDKQRWGSATGIYDAWEGDANTAPATPRSPPQTVVGRGSPWARSPSRETAGGILVKHSFFYGSGGRAGSEALPARGRNFESQWMRQFREEVQANPNWWAGSDQCASAARSAAESLNTFLRGTGPRAVPVRYPSAANMPTGDQGWATRSTDLWREVRSLLANDRRGEDRRVGNAVTGADGEARAIAPDRVDVLSFGDRLRYTPLSQGAWVVDRSGGARSRSVGEVPDSDGQGRAVIEAEKQSLRARRLQAAEGGRGPAADGAGEKSGTGDVKARGGQQALGGGGGTGEKDNSKAAHRSNLLSVHDAILTRLRGEIDSATREEIVLRAAEDARGALERDRASSNSPRRPSIELPRASPTGTMAHSLESIDYDKVEATLSLIELASRAAGPDAGKQMLQALEGLDKMHQGGVVDETAKKGRTLVEDVNARGDGLPAEALASGEERVIDADGASAAEQEVVGENETADLGVTTASGLHDTEGDSMTEKNRRENVNESSPGAPTQRTGSRQFSQRASLAVSTSSNESEGSNSPGGVIQSIGNWLWGGKNTPSRTSSGASNVGSLDHGGGKGGNAQLGFTLSEEAPAPDDLETGGVVGTSRGSDVRESDKECLAANPGVAATHKPEETQPEKPQTRERENPEAIQESETTVPTLVAPSDIKIKGKKDMDHVTPTSETVPGISAPNTDAATQVVQSRPTPMRDPVAAGPRPDELTREASGKGEITISSVSAVPGARVRNTGAGATIARKTEPPMQPLQAGTTPSEGFLPRDRAGAKSAHTRQLHPKPARKDAHPGLMPVRQRDRRAYVGARAGRMRSAKVPAPVKEEGVDTNETAPSGVEDVSSAAATDAVGRENKAGGRPAVVKSSASPKISVHFVWPRPGQLCVAKQTQPAERDKRKAASFAFTPGIVRRSPLVDAFHPAVAKQRAFQQQLRRTHQREVPVANTANDEQPQDQAQRTRTHRGEKNVPVVAVAAAKPTRTTARRRGREPLSAAPLPPPPPAPAPQPPRPSPLARSSKADLGARPDSNSSSSSSSRVDVAARAGRLTAQQWVCMEAWMARARQSLGPMVCDCLGSGGTFSSTQNRIREAVLPRGRGQALDQSSGPLGNIPRVWRSVPSEEGVSGEEGLRGHVELDSDTKRRQGPRVASETCERRTRGWDDHLSQKAALAIEAVMWTLATEHERSTTCAAIARSRNQVHPRGGKVDLGAEHGRSCGYDGRKRTHTDSSLVTTELGVSLPRARRFVKASRLIDGIHVLEADVDLAFKRWGEIERERRVAAAIPVSADVRATLPADQLSTERADRRNRCEAVGCSELARYGDILPMATAKLCRKHKMDGMVDVGGRRCEMPDCGRLAAGGSDARGATVGNALCTLHATGGRVDLEGLSFVLLELASARLTRVRAPTPTSALPSAESAALFPSAVRNILLALSDQPLVPSSLAPSHALTAGAQSCALHGHARSDAGSSSHRDILSEMTALSAQSVSWPPERVGSFAPPKSSVGRGQRGIDPASGLVSERPHQDSRPVVNGGDVSNRRESASPLSFSSVTEGVDDQCDATFPTEAKRGRSFLWQEAALAGEESVEGLNEGGSDPADIKKGEVFFECTGRGGWPRVCVTNGGDDSMRDAIAVTTGGTSTERYRHSPDPWDLGGTACSWPRLQGVYEVLGKNANPLKAVFQTFSRPAHGSKEMALPDVMRFCDVFELRPGLVSTREVLDAFKEVVFPGVMGLTDQEIGYFQEVSAPSAGGNSLSLPSRSPHAFEPARSRSTGPNDTCCEGGSGMARMHEVTPAVAGTAEGTAEAGAGGAAVRAAELLEEQDECSVYFRSDSVGENRVASSSRRASTCSGSGGGGGKGKRTVYLGRTQAFPLRRVDSSLDSGGRRVGFGCGFELSDVSDACKAGNALRKRASCRRSPGSQAGSSSRRTSLSLNPTSGEGEAREPPVAPGMSQSQFFEWLAEVSVRCSSLSKTFNQGFARGPSVAKGSRRPGKGLNSSLGSGRGAGVGGGVTRQNVAKAVALLQWMELSRGMRKESIPTFRLAPFILNNTIS